MGVWILGRGSEAGEVDGEMKQAREGRVEKRGRKGGRASFGGIP